MAYNSPHTEAICTLIHTLYKEETARTKNTSALFIRVQLRPFLHIINKANIQYVVVYQISHSNLSYANDM